MTKYDRFVRYWWLWTIAIVGLIVAVAGILVGSPVQVTVPACIVGGVSLGAAIATMTSRGREGR
jgi:NO-binding membrane sensor protein with MHYT domain